jgi:hypothetical protein
MQILWHIHLFLTTCDIMSGLLDHFNWLSVEMIHVNQTATVKWYKTVTLRLTRFELYPVQIKGTEAIAEGRKRHMRLFIRRGRWQHQVLNHCTNV